MTYAGTDASSYLGIYNYTSEPNFVNDGMVHRTTDEMVEFIAKLPKTQDFEPGTDWSYSNSAYFILGGVMEKAAGEPLATVLKTRLFVPIGMTHTALDDETELVPGRVRGYSGAGPGKFSNAPFISMSIPGGAGSIRSTAADLANGMRRFFGGKILKPTLLAAMLTPGRLNNGENLGSRHYQDDESCRCARSRHQTRIRVCPVCVARGRPSQNQSRRRNLRL